MEWINIVTGDPGLKKYHLVKDGVVQMVLKYHLLQQSVRISHKGKHEVFFMESTGNRNNRMVFKNVYGIEVGRFSYANRNHSGRIHLEQIELQYTVIDKARSSVVLYKQSKQQPLVVCHLPQDSRRQPVQIDNLERACLFTGLCWYCSLFFNNTTAQYQF